MSENNQDQLRQLTNAVEIVGTLKTKDLVEKLSKKGNQMIVGTLVVVSKFEDKVNELTIKVQVMASSKLYKGIQTVMKEYKASDDCTGDQKPDRVKISGELKFNQYYNKNGKLVEFNEIKGVFYNRLDAEHDQPDKAIASIEVVVEGFSDVIDSDGLPTGDKQIDGFTVGYGNDIVELKNAIVKAELADAFQNLYAPGQTGRLSFRINNYALVKEPEVTEAPAHGFGSTETVEANVVKDYVNNLEIIGGDIPYFGSREYTPEEIEKVQQLREINKAALQPSVPDTPPTGFGNNGNTPTPPPSNDDMPDF